MALRLEALVCAIGRAVSWLTLAMALITLAVVILRYGLGIGNIALQQSVMYLHGAVFMAAAGYTLARDEHVRVDIFYQHLSARRRALVDLLGTVLLLIPVCVLILVVSWDYVLSSWQRQEGSSEPGGLDYIYLLKTLLWVLPALLLAQGVVEAVRASQRLRDPEAMPRPREPGEEQRP